MESMSTENNDGQVSMFAESMRNSSGSNIRASADGASSGSRRVASATVKRPSLLEAKEIEARRAQEAMKNKEKESMQYMYASATPWMDDVGNVIWTPARMRAYWFTSAQNFEATMGCVIIFNMVLIMWETDYRAQCYPAWAPDLSLCPYKTEDLTWLGIVELVLLLVYTLEAALHVYVHRAMYFRNRLNLVDFSVVILGWLSIILGNMVKVGYLRVFRTVRLVRAFRSVLTIRELYMLLTGIISSFKAIFFGMFLLGLLLLLWSIVLVEFVHPVNALLDYEGCERCPRGFESVMASTLTLFQTVIAGDSWGTLAVPIIENAPATALILVTIVVSISLGVMNLILAVIVESASEAREQDIEEKAKRKAEEQTSTKHDLLQICKEMDTDCSGSIGMQEMMDAFQMNARFRKIMMILEIEEDEIENIFHFMDSDSSGEVDYVEFCDHLYALKTNETRVMLSMNKYYVSELQKQITADLLDLRQVVVKHGQVLTENNKMLRCLDTKDHHQFLVPDDDAASCVDLLGRGAGSGRLNVGDITRPRPPPQPFTGAKVPEPQSFESNRALDMRTSSPTDVMADLGDLQKQMEALAVVSADVVKKADEQASTLSRQAQFLESLAQALRRPPPPRSNRGTVAPFSAAADPSAPQAGGSSGAGPELDAVSVHVGRLERHVRERLAVLVQDLEHRVDEVGGALASGSQLLEVVRGLGAATPGAAASVPEAKTGGLIGAAPSSLAPN